MDKINFILLILAVIAAIYGIITLQWAMMLISVFCIILVMLTLEFIKKNQGID
jgi:membrane protein implicated in regulation of membrane protease activity